MSLNFFSFVQSKEEIEFILNKEQNIIFIPLNLNTLVFLKMKNLKFVDLKKILNNSNYKKFINFSEKFLNSIKFDKFEYEAVKIQFKSQIRFMINSCIYILEIFNRLNNKKKIRLIQSGWNGRQENYKSDELFLASKILANSLISENINFLTNDYKNQINRRKVYEYKTSSVFIPNNSILINNLGYNFYRILLFKNFFQKVYRIKLENEKKIKINWVKKLLFFIIGYKEIKITKDKKINNKNFKFPEIKLEYGNYDISKIINDRKIELEHEVSETHSKIKAIKKIPNLKNFKFYFSYHCRGLDGSISEILEPTECKTVVISHGTVSKFYSKYDAFYKKIIAESVFSGKFKKYAVQSKICEKSLFNTNKKIKNIIKTNNLIFSNVRSSIRNKNKILYAVTVKKFNGLQFFGVEMYYEFFDNLNLLNDLSILHNKLKIIVNLHSSHKNLVNKIKYLFPNLIITSEKIDNLINQSFVIISFSSTAIEDAVASNRFVILLDQWKRYRHFKGNTHKNLSTIFYVNDKLQLTNIIEKLLKKRIKFKFYNSPNKIKNNFRKIFNT